MTFEEWWKGYYKPTSGGRVFDAGVREAAEATWEAATAAERERCAKVCEASRVVPKFEDDYRDGWNNAISECAAAIRAR